MGSARNVVAISGKSIPIDVRNVANRGLKMNQELAPQTEKHLTAASAITRAIDAARPRVHPHPKLLPEFLTTSNPPPVSDYSPRIARISRMNPEDRLSQQFAHAETQSSRR
jgi:hypothetical protein